MSSNPSDGGVGDQKPLDNSASEADESRLEIEEQKTANELKKAKDFGEHTMHVKVYSPFRDYYDGQTFSLSGENLTGPFDILPMHHNFISLLTPCELVIRTVQDQDKPVRIKISGGILHVKADEILIFLDV